MARFIPAKDPEGLVNIEAIDYVRIVSGAWGEDSRKPKAVIAVLRCGTHVELMVGFKDHMQLFGYLNWRPDNRFSISDEDSVIIGEGGRGGNAG